MADEVEVQLHRLADEQEHRGNQIDELLGNNKEMMKQLERINGSIHDIIVEIGGVPQTLGREPDRRSLRWRIHTLEVDRSAAIAAQAAVTAASKVFDAATERRFSHREKLAGLALAFLLVAITVASMLVTLTHHA